MINKKKLIHWLHLWPGLISSIIVLVVCVTGTILVYSDEIMELSAGKARYVEKVLPNKLPSEELVKIAVGSVKGARQASYMVAFRDPSRSVRFNVFSREAGLFLVYLDQYSGKVLKVDKTIFFFYTTAHIHDSLFLGKTGQWIVDIATIIFLIEIITGIVLWWPKKWKKSAITIKWNAPWKRLSFDMHRIFGIYASVILLILISTGLIIAFEPLKDATIKFLDGEDAHHWEHSVSKDYNPSTARIAINTALSETFEKFPDKKEIKIALWEYESSPFFLLAATNRSALKSAESPELIYIDRRSGKINDSVPQSVIRGEKIDNMVWMLHMGNWMGPIGKFLTFLGGLIACLLPITGFYIWWNKRTRRK
jgi:uncharacterized iron-regulated membrane protein